MATTTNPLSWEAFEQFPDDGMHHELIEGEHQILPPPKSGHSRIAERISRGLRPLEALGSVFWEAGYKLSDSPASWVQPDISFLRQERVEATPSEGYYVGAPELAVEIVSPSETARDLERKVELLLASGAQMIWVIYPDSRTVYEYKPDGAVSIRSTDDTLQLANLLPGWQLPVATLFED